MYLISRKWFDNETYIICIHVTCTYKKIIDISSYLYVITTTFLNCLNCLTFDYYECIKIVCFDNDCLMIKIKPDASCRTLLTEVVDPARD